MQAGIINPFITRPEHSQFILLVAIALVIVNVLLIVFGPDARNVQTLYSFDSFLVGPLIIDATKAYAGAATIVITAALFGFFRFSFIPHSKRPTLFFFTPARVICCHFTANPFLFITFNVRCIEISHFNLCHGLFFLSFFTIVTSKSIKYICKLPVSIPHSNLKRAKFESDSTVHDSFSQPK